MLPSASFFTRSQAGSSALHDPDSPSSLETAPVTQSLLTSSSPSSLPSCSCHSLQLLTRCQISPVPIHTWTSSVFYLLWLGECYFFFPISTLSHHLCHVLLPEGLGYLWTQRDSIHFRGFDDCDASSLLRGGNNWSETGWLEQSASICRREENDWMQRWIHYARLNLCLSLFGVFLAAASSWGAREKTCYWWFNTSDKKVLKLFKEHFCFPSNSTGDVSHVQKYEGWSLF